MKKIPLLVPHMPQTEHLLPYLKKIDENQWYTNFGPLNTEFERRLIEDTAPWLNEKNITTISNCTVGLELALQANGLPTGARVLIPAITFVATATAVLRVGMIPVLADVDPIKWVLTPKIARAACSNMKIDAVMPVSTFGYAHDMNKWDEFCFETGIPVIVDAAGAYGNQTPGHLADVVYSFHATKSFGAAEGGAVISANEERISMIRKLANFGIDTATGLLSGCGTNGKMSEYHCAIGLASFNIWEETKRIRRQMTAKYTSLLLRACKNISFQEKDPGGVYPLMPVALPNGADIQSIRSLLATEGIETRRWYSPSLKIHPALTSCQTTDDLPIASNLGERILGLPFFIGLKDSQMEYVCTTLNEILRSQIKEIPQ